MKINRRDFAGIILLVWFVAGALFFIGGVFSGEKVFIVYATTNTAVLVAATLMGCLFAFLALPQTTNDERTFTSLQKGVVAFVTGYLAGEIREPLATWISSGAIFNPTWLPRLLALVIGLATGYIAMYLLITSSRDTPYTPTVTARS